MTRLNLLKTPTFRLVLTSSAIFGLSALIMFGVMYFAVARAMQHQVDAEIKNEIAALADTDGHPDTERLVNRVGHRIARNRQPGTYYLVEDENGKVLAGDLPGQPVPFAGTYDLPSPTADPEHVLRGAGVSFSNGINLLVARDVYTLDEVADLMENTFIGGILLTLVAALLSGAFVSKKISQRLETINRTSRDIMAGDLGRRIPVNGNDRDFDELAINLNAMLTRIENLMDDVRQVTDNIAHDMRTPLTRLRQHLERVRLSGGTVEEYRNAVDIALLSTDELLDTFGALLRIAQIEVGMPVDGPKPVDLSTVCALVAETYEPVAEADGHRLVSAIVPGLIVEGDQQLLIQMLVNLVENAVQHNTEPVEIRILLHQIEGDGPVLCVSDDGVGIPMEERENVLRRFYRLDAARSTQGSGLGMSMAAAISNYHGATLAVEDNNPGVKIVIRFPKK